MKMSLIAAAAGIVVFGLGNGAMAQTVAGDNHQRGAIIGAQAQLGSDSNAYNQVYRGGDEEAYELGYRAGVAQGKRDGIQAFNSAGTGPGYGD